MVKKKIKKRGGNNKKQLLFIIPIMLICLILAAVYSINRNNEKIEEAKEFSSTIQDINLESQTNSNKNSDNAILSNVNQPKVYVSGGGGSSGGGGNNDLGVSCAPTPRCGDGIINQAWEECDDGNNKNKDGCSSDCKIEKCWNANTPNEECECFGFNFFVAKWECNCTRVGDFSIECSGCTCKDKWTETETVYNGTFVNGTCSLAYWNVGTSGADGIVAKAATYRIAINGTNGSIGKINGHDLSHITFCGYEEEEECGNGILESEEECDLGQENGEECEPPYDGSCVYCSDTCENITLKDGYCGDNELQEQYEDCELPDTDNNPYCSQSIEECSGNKLGVRDKFGFCDIRCGCVPDIFEYECVKDKCNAKCGNDDDCEKNSCDKIYDDYCQDTKLADYNADGIFNSLDVYDECNNTCDLENSCSCSDCEINCDAEPLIQCAEGECEAECDEDEDCDDNNVDTIDTCLDSCICKNEYIPRCGNGIKDENEECDDGNLENFDECRNDCTLPYCGDNIIDKIFGEQCDGSICGCEEKCTEKSHKLYTVVECIECNCDYSKYKCVVGKCGAECDEDEDCMCKQDECDGTTLVDYPEYGRCGTADEEGCLCQIDTGEEGDCEPILIEDALECYTPYCGNGIKDENEECDDGNSNNDDECANDCKLTYCGDEIIQFPNGHKEYEECEIDTDCDDKNEHTSDTCSDCACSHEDIPYCGDGIIQQDLGEECELPNTETCDENCKWRITCYENSDCGKDGWIENPFCICTTNVWDWRIKYECKNPGTIESYCTNSSKIELKEPCGADYCDDWENTCYNNDVYKSRDCYDKGCKSGECFNNTYVNREKIEECYSDYCESYWNYYCEGNNAYKNRTCYDRGCENAGCLNKPYENEVLVEECEVCIDGKCEDVECHNDSECPADKWLGQEFCWCGKLFDYHIDYSCENDGTPESYCDSEMKLKIKGNCPPLLAAVSMAAGC